MKLSYDDKIKKFISENEIKESSQSHRLTEGAKYKKGQKVQQGDVIGTVGSTGRSTGAHLDIRLNWFQTRLDPATVLDIK